jgi:hypothetical protein
MLTAGAPVVYLLWPGDLTWWLAPFLVAPLVGLALWRHEQRGFPDEFAGGGDGGAWAPPADHGGGL